MEFNIITKSKWVDADGIYQSGKTLLLGKVKMANVYYNGSLPRNTPNKYSVSATMSGIKPRLGKASNQEN